MFDAFITAYRGLMWAILLVWIAFVVKKVGVQVLPLVGLPLLAAAFLGYDFGYGKGWEHSRVRKPADDD